jgi:NAD(P)H dehydrogenase (quinone)
MATPTKDTILVTGASGHLGRAVLHHLVNTHQVPAGQIIAATRKPEGLADLAKLGVGVRAADFDSPDLAKSFAGARRLLLISTDAMDRPGRRLEQHRKAVKAAKEAGVQHIVYTSMPNPSEDSPIPFAGDHRGTEEAIAASGMTHTILRNSWYMENLLMSLPGVLAAGKWYTASGTGKWYTKTTKGRLSYGSRDDFARAAAAVLASGAKDSRTYTLTGPEALTADDIAKIAGDALGKKIKVRYVTPKQLAGGMKTAGLPDMLIPLMVSFDVNTAQGRMETVTSDIKDLTGKAPQTLRDWFAQNKAMFGA